MKYNFSIVDYKDIWEGFYKKYGGKHFGREYYKNGVPKHYKFVKELMDEYKEEYGKEWVKRRGYHDVEEFYKE